MQTRFSLPLSLVLLTGLFAACDSEPGVSRVEVDGVYSVQTFTFDPVATFLNTVNVRARLDTSYTQLSFASGSAEYVLNFRFPGTPPQTYIISGGYDTEGDNRVVVNFGDDRDRLRLLLPPEVKFNYDEVAGLLSVDANIVANLEEYDPEQYSGTGVPLTAVNGRLNIVLRRR